MARRRQPSVQGRPLVIALGVAWVGASATKDAVCFTLTFS